jgi:putative aminopeptidase FrvX
MTPRKLRQLLDRLLVTHSPSGDEREMDEIVGQELSRFCPEVWQDPHGNLVGKLPGRSPEGAIQVFAHKDEIGAIVDKIDEDGKVWLDPLGGAYAWIYAEGPLDLLGDEVVTGVLSVGSKHTSDRSTRIHKAKTNPLGWDMCYVDCKLSKAELAKKGIHTGSRAVVSRCRKPPLYLGDHVCCYALDDKALVAVMLLVGEELAQHDPPPVDVYLVATAAEETGCSGGVYAALSLPGDTVIALDIAPVAEEYPVVLDDRPVVGYRDLGIYHKALSDGFVRLAEELGFGAQRALFRSLGTDGSAATNHGHIGRAAYLGIPTENTHGYEISRLGAMLNLARLVSTYLTRAEPPASQSIAPGPRRRKKATRHA